MDLAKSEPENNLKEKYIRVLKSGSVKEKAMMIGNHLANISYGDDGFLTQEEITALVDSIKSDKEHEIYKQYQTMFRDTDTFLSSIAQCRLTYLGALYRLDARLIVMECYESLERVTNNLLNLIPDKKTAIEVVAAGAFPKKQYKPPALHYLVEPDNEDHIKVIYTSHRHDEDIPDIQTQVKNEQVRLKTAIQAAKDFMKEKKFNVRAFSKYLKGIEDWVKKDKKELMVLKVDRKSPELPITEPDYMSTEISTKDYQLFRDKFLHG